MRVIATRRAKADRSFTEAFTLLEVVVSIMITGLVFAGILTGYVTSARRTEWSGFSLAAEGLNIQQLEQVRAAAWDTQGGSYKDETTNLNLKSWTYANGKWSGYSWTNLDTPFNTTNKNVVVATNYVTLRTIIVVSNPAPVEIKFITSETVWSFRGKSFTNAIATYRSPDT